jgi:hypothetical protein
MIAVTGTGRCGTSAWMQVFAAAGYEVLGEAFPLDWERRLSTLNPGGFFESTLVAGVNLLTNPDPHSGARLVPEDTRALVLKVFAPGVCRTERVWLDRVLLSFRPWDGFARSRQQLLEVDGREPSTAAQAAASWFAQHHDLGVDAARRGYLLHAVDFDALCAAPREGLAAAFARLGLEAPPEGTEGAIRPSTRRWATPTEPLPLPDGWEEPLAHLLELLRRDALPEVVREPSLRAFRDEAARAVAR